LQEPALLVLGHRIRPAGEVVVDLGGELDIVSAEMAVSYVSSVIDRYRRPAEPVTPRRGSLSRWLAMAGGARRSAQGRGR
jgi:hypothetical protein